MDLYRLSDSRMISGVCAGIAEKYKWDPSVVRLVAVLGTVFTGFWLGIIVYIAAAIIIPDISRKVQ